MPTSRRTVMAAGNSNQSGTGWGSGNVVIPELTGWEANKPSGLSLIRETSFGNLLTGTSVNADGFAIANNDPANVAWSNGTDMAAPYGPNVVQWDYTGGSNPSGAADSVLYTNSTTGYVKAYFCLAAFFSENYSWHSNGEKFWYPTIATPGQASQQTAINLRFTDGESGMDPASPINRFSFNSQIGGAGSLYYPLSDAAYLFKGQWQLVEMFIQMNTPGNQDGVWQAWIDGIKVADSNSLRFTNYPGSPQSTFNGGLRFSTTRGGGTSSVAVPAEGMFRRFNRLAYYGSTSF